MRTISWGQPGHVVIGAGALDACAPYLIDEGARRVLVVTGTRTGLLAAPLIETLRAAGVEATLWSGIAGEPTLDVFAQACAAARSANADTIVGLGGGSALDAAKLVAGVLGDARPVQALFGIDTLGRRRARLVCVPTTAGTGSEVSPNAILLDETQPAKRAVISRHLVPDAAFIDPALACGLPSDVTAATGLDALTHCIEAYANRRAHPVVDDWALAGIRWIGAHLVRAVNDGGDLAAREALARGSLYGGMCLGPVNTAAVHALAYPLGGLFRVGHGLSNAVLLPYVLEHNLPAAPDRYAAVAVALGARVGRDELSTARAGIAAIRALSRACGLPAGLDALGIPREAIPQLADSALTVRRLLDNNPRAFAREDVLAIYARTFEPATDRDAGSVWRPPHADA